MDWLYYIIAFIFIFIVIMFANQIKKKWLENRVVRQQKKLIKMYEELKEIRLAIQRKESVKEE